MWGEVTQRFTAIVVIPQRLKEEETLELEKEPDRAEERQVSQTRRRTECKGA